VKTQKQLNEFKEGFNKHWNKTKKLRKNKISEIKKAGQDVKEVLHKDVESFKKKKSNRIPGNKSSLSQIKNTGESLYGGSSKN
jgi:hypothetical protein